MTYDPDDDRPPTLPGATSRRRVAPLDDTLDELDPVERRSRVVPVAHERRRPSRADLEGRVAQLEVDIDVPTWAEFAEMRAEVAACKRDRLRRARWRWAWTAVRSLTAASVVGALGLATSALIEYGDARGAGRRETARIEAHEAHLDRHEAKLERHGDALLLLLQHAGIPFDLRPRGSP